MLYMVDLQGWGNGTILPEKELSRKDGLNSQRGDLTWTPKGHLTVFGHSE
jgi:hypothetical protein